MVNHRQNIHFFLKKEKILKKLMVNRRIFDLIFWRESGGECREKIHFCMYHMSIFHVWGVPKIIN